MDFHALSIACVLIGSISQMLRYQLVIFVYRIASAFLRLVVGAQCSHFADSVAARKVFGNGRVRDNIRHYADCGHPQQNSLFRHITRNNIRFHILPPSTPFTKIPNGLFFILYLLYFDRIGIRPVLQDRRCLQVPDLPSPFLT